MMVMRRSDITRSIAAALSGLSKATVSRVVDELLADGLIVDGLDNQTVGRGRPSRFLAVAPALGYVVGVDTGITTTRLLAADINGCTVASPLSCPVPPNRWDIGCERLCRSS